MARRRQGGYSVHRLEDDLSEIRHVCLRKFSWRKTSWYYSFWKHWNKYAHSLCATRIIWYFQSVYNNKHSIQQSPFPFKQAVARTAPYTPSFRRESSPGLWIVVQTCPIHLLLSCHVTSEKALFSCRSPLWTLKNGDTGRECTRVLVSLLSLSSRCPSAHLKIKVFSKCAIMFEMLPNIVIYIFTWRFYPLFH
jgi:hypothetical protein